jgi:regulator of RNase E activity RraA
MIHDRDFIVADNDGQVVIPNETIREVLEKVIEIDAGDKDVGRCPHPSCWISQ